MNTSPAQYEMVRSSPLGVLKLVATDDALIELSMGSKGQPTKRATHPLLERASRQLDE